MEIKKEMSDGKLTLKPIGELDSFSAKELLDAAGTLEGVTSLTLDFAEVGYIASSGIRTVLTLKKAMLGKGDYKILNLSQMVRDVFDMTGTLELLGIQ